MLEWTNLMLGSAGNSDRTHGPDASGSLRPYRQLVDQTHAGHPALGGVSIPTSSGTGRSRLTAPDLLTSDGRLANAPGSRCPIRLLQ